MNPDIPVDTDLAVRQWQRLRDTYASLWAPCTSSTPSPACPTWCTPPTVDSSVGDRIVAAQLRLSRTGTRRALRRMVCDARGRDRGAAPKVSKRARVISPRRRSDLGGTGFRTDRDTHAEIAEITGLPVITLELVDPRFLSPGHSAGVLTRTPSPTTRRRSPCLRVLRELFPTRSSPRGRCAGVDSTWSPTVITL